MPAPMTGSIASTGQKAERITIPQISANTSRASRRHRPSASLPVGNVKASVANRANVSDTLISVNQAMASWSGEAVMVCSSRAVASIGRNAMANVQPIPSSTQPIRFRGRLVTRIEPTPAYGT